MPRTTLLYAPFVSENRAFPPLSLPALAAYLRRHGYPVAQFDVNIDFYRWITGDAVLEMLDGRLKKLLAAYPGPPRSLLDLDHYCNLSDAIHVWLPYIRSALKANGGDMSRLEGTQCLYVLDKLALILGLERQNHKALVEMTSEEMITEISQSDQSLFAVYLRDKVLPQIQATQPDLVGFSLMIEQQIFPSLMLAHYLRRQIPSVHIVMGGGLISAVADKVGKKSAAIFSLVDTFVAFDGEESLLRLLQCLECRQPFNNVPNLIYFDSEAHRVVSTPVSETGALDELPIPDFEGIDFNRYTRRILPYYVSKGCVYGRCAYCSDPAYSSARNRSPNRAAAEIEALVNRYRPDTLLFVDSYIHPRYMEPIAREMIERKVKVKWVTQTRMDRFLTSESLEVFAHSGCSELWFGMETVNPRMIRLIRKGSKKEIIMRILDDCWQSGIKVTLNCMIGFPTETVEEASDTMDFIDTLNQIYPELIFKCNTGFVFVPRLSAFGQTPEKFGITVVDEFEWSPRLEWIPPEWRYQERFLTLDGQMFEKSYQGAQALREKAKSLRTVDVSRNTTIGLSPGCHLATTSSNLVQLWKKVFQYQTAIVAIQRERRCSKDEAVSVIDARIQTDSSIVQAYAGSGTYAYVVEDGSWRRMVPLNVVYRLIVGWLDTERQAWELHQNLQALYCDHSAEEVEKALFFAVRYLALSGVIELDAQRIDKPSLAKPSPVFHRRNLGQTSAEEEDCDPVADCESESMPASSQNSQLVQIQQAG